MEPFAPQSWEMPPGARVLEESASVVAREFDGERLNWKVALVEVPTHFDPILWMRPLDARFDAGFIVYDFVHFNVDTRKADERSAHFSKLLPLFWEQNRLGRTLFFNTDGELRGPDDDQAETLLITPEGLAVWGLGIFNREKHPAWKFNWSAPLTNDEFLRLPALKVWARVQQLLAEPKSEAQFSREFMFMTEQERLNTVFKKSVLTHKEVETLMHTLLLTQDVWDEVPEADRLQLISLPESHTSLWLEEADYGLRVSESLKAQIAQLWSQYRIADKGVLNRLCVQNWYEYKTPKFVASSSRPTAHEQLEAALRWRQWKENHEKI